MNSVAKGLYHHVQLISSFLNPLGVVAVHHKYQTLEKRTHVTAHVLQCRVLTGADVLQHLCVSVVMSPQGSDDSLATDVPNCKTDVSVLDRLHIKTCANTRTVNNRSVFLV